MLSRITVLAYAMGAYVLSMLSIAYLMGFIIGFGVPKTINDGELIPPLWALLNNGFLITCFGLHHSITARLSFKRWWTRLIPKYLERATYLYMTTIMVALLVYFWKPIPTTVWQIEQPLTVLFIYGFYLLIWTAMFLSTFPIGHLSFFGLAQAWEHAQKKASKPNSFTKSFLYALIRHPISLGWILTAWCTPHMTAGQLSFALFVFIYVAIATIYEEKDLLESLGDTYRDYRHQVSAFIPNIKKKR